MRVPSESVEADRGYQPHGLIVDYNDRKKYRKDTFTFVLKILLVFAFALLVLFRYASITEIGHKINQTQKKYEQAVEENRKLNKELAEYSNLADLKQIAEERFGMKLPEGAQKVYIDPVSCDRTEIVNIELTEDKGESEVKMSLIERLKRFVGLV